MSRIYPILNKISQSRFCRINMAKPDIESTIYLRSSISHAKPRNPARTYLVYFITGNPGLIEYYRTFLTHLYGLLSTSSSSSSSSSSIHSPNFHIFGRSLSGFEVDDVCSKDKSTGFPYSLREQITRSGNALKELAGDLKGKDGRQPKVILVGHSVGSYILLELIRELREGLARGGEVDVGVDVVGGICLFPTVVDIARSNSGRSGGVCYLSFTSVSYHSQKLVLERLYLDMILMSADTASPPQICAFRILIR